MARRYALVDKTKKPPIPDKPKSAEQPKQVDKQPQFVRGTIDPTTKK